MEILEQEQSGKALHDTDLVAWAESNAAKLRHGSDLDEEEREQIAEELWLIAASNRRELRSRITTLLTHLLKRQYQPEMMGRSWALTIALQRRETKQLLRESPSLLPLLRHELHELYIAAKSDAEVETGLDRFPVNIPFTLDQLFED